MADRFHGEDTTPQAVEQHNCEYSFARCKRYGEGSRVESAGGADAWACASCATKLSKTIPAYRLTALEAADED